jgi:protein involved in polysaccharide export with SLBB domain
MVHRRLARLLCLAPLHQAVTGATAAVLLLVGLAAGCAGQRSRPPEVAPLAADVIGARDRARLETLVAARAAHPPEAGYRIGPDDLLDVRIPDLLDVPPEAPLAAPTGAVPAGAVVAGTPVFQRGLRVDAAGTITIPMLGTVEAAGRTASALEQDIAHALVARGILRDPHVSVLVVEYRARVVAVVGSVERPGPYPLTRAGATVADMIWAAGGPSKDAGRIVEFAPAADDQAVVRPQAVAVPTAPAGIVVRVAAVEPSAAALGVRSVRLEPAGAGRRVTIELSRAPDTVRDFPLAAPPRLVIDLSGPTAGPAAERFPTGDAVVPAVRTTARDGGLRAVLDLGAEGLAHRVRVDGVAVVADIGEARTTAAASAATSSVAAGGGAPIRLDLDALLHATGQPASVTNPEVRVGDVISIAPAGAVQVDGWVDKPGSYPVTRGLTVSGAVAAAGGKLFPANLHAVTVKRVLAPGEERLFTIDLAAVAAGRMPDVPVTDGDVVRVPYSAPKLVPWGAWELVYSLVRFGAYGTGAIF